MLQLFFILYFITYLTCLFFVVDYFKVTSEQFVLYFLMLSIGMYISVNLKSIFYFFKKIILDTHNFIFNFSIIDFSFMFNEFSLPLLQNLYKRKLIKLIHNKTKNNNDFLTKFFIRLELSIKKNNDFFYFLRVTENQELLKSLNLNICNNDLNEILFYISNKETEQINKKYDLKNKENLSITEIAEILLSLSDQYSSFSEYLKFRYTEYFVDTPIYFRLMIGICDYNNLLFPLVAKLQNYQFSEQDLRQLEKEKIEKINFLNINRTIHFRISSSFKLKDDFFQYKLLPLNFPEVLNNQFNDNFLIDEFNSFLSNYQTLASIDNQGFEEVQAFIKKITSLKLYNELFSNLDKNTKINQKILKI